MKRKTFLAMLLLLVAGAVQTLRAQQSVNVGNQVTSESSIVSGKAYILKTGADRYITDNGTNYDVPNSANAATEASVYYLVSDGDGTWKIKNLYTNKYWGVPVYNTALTSVDEASAGVWSLNFSSNVAYPSCPDADGTVRGIDRTGGKVWSWATGTNANHQVYIYEIGLNVNEVYTLNNTKATNRGALVYDGSSTNVEAIASTSLDATNPNHQWVFYYTGTPGQYYLYNVGAGKFAIPTAIAQGSDNPWVFSSNAVAVTLLKQSDGTYRIKAAKDPVSGTSVAVISINRNSGNHVFNYNDAGSDFIITKVDGADQSTAAQAAVAKLVGSQTALTAPPSESGWYAVQINTSSTASHAGRFVKVASSEYTYNGTSYPLTFEGAINVNPAIADVTYLTYIDVTNKYWQMPNGKYLMANSNNKFPVSTTTPTAINTFGRDAKGNYFKGNSSYYAVPYHSGANYFIGESSTYQGYNVYPIDLAEAGLTAWQVTINGASESTQLTCTRSDVKGLTSVYNNGFFFLPTSATPTESDFTLTGMISCTVDAANHTITADFDPTLALLADGVSVEQGWQTAGRGGEVMLLRVTAKPFQTATGAKMTVALKDGSEANISKLTLYEADSSSPEVLSTGEGAPTLTVVDEVDVTTSTETLNIGNFTAGTHYYWIGATVKGDATLGSIVDAAVSGITYTCSGKENTLDLTANGDPNDRGAMVFNVHSYPFLPRDNGSRVYRIPSMVVADDGSIVVACDKRYDSHTDIGKGHVIDIVVRRSTDGGQTWSEPVVIAKGDNSNDATCGYGDPSLIKGKDGKIYCFFGAGNIGYFYGLNRICMSVSTDNGQTWSSSAANPPADLVSTGKVTDHANAYGSNTCYGLYDYFVTSGRGLCTSEGYLMGLLPAQVYTNEGKTEKTSNSQDYIFYSTDQGQTWHFSEQAIFTGGDEAKVIQRNDGSLIASVRQGYNRGFNTATYTLNPDGTLNFTMGTQWNNSQLNAGGNPNNQDIFYYQRVSETGKTDVIFHSMTTGQHANFKLYYSTDEGANWTEFLTVQTKGTRYVTMEKSATGSLYLFFEDQSLNSAGGYQDYNHYPLNFVEITRDQLVQLIPELEEDYYPSEGVKVVYGTTGHTTYGSLSGDTWTSNASSGVAGLTLTKSGGSFDKYSNWNGHFNLAYKPAAANVASTLTLTAPEGYAITGYSFLAAKASSTAHTYTIGTSDGQTITPAFNNNAGTAGYTKVSMTGLSTQSETISITSTDVSKYLAIADFTVTLTPRTDVALTACNGMSYATLYLPYSYELSGDAKAYIINSIDNDKAMLSELGQEVPALTPVVLRSETAATSTQATYKPSVTADATGNQLQGITMTQHVDGYVLNIKNNEPGFYKLSDTGRLAANRAYLPTSVVGELGVKGLILQWTDADGIEGVQSSEQGVMVNGKWLNGECHDLSGRRIQKPTRGLYIVGGRKVIVK